MILLLDNDAVLKLCAFDLLDTACTCLGVASSEVHVLPTAKYYMRKDSGHKLSNKYGAAGLQRAISFVEKARVLEDPPEDRSEYDHLTKIAQEEALSIDPGELLLFAVTALFSDFALLTGDKNALKSLQQATGCEAIHERIQGRVYCIEQIIGLLIDSVGFQSICDCVVPARGCDTALGWNSPDFFERELSSE